MKRIRMTNQEYDALVDNEDYLVLSQYSWYFNNGYAARMGSKRHPNRKGKRRIIYMHRVVAGVQHPHTGKPLKRRRVRVLSGDKLDCRRNNIR